MQKNKIQKSRKGHKKRREEITREGDQRFFFLLESSIGTVWRIKADEKEKVIEAGIWKIIPCIENESWAQNKKKAYYVEVCDL